MQYFEQQGQRIIWRNRGETLVVEPWGPDSLRVRSVLMGEVRDERFALLDPVPCQNVEIGIEAEKAFIRCGKITARLEVAGWQRRARLTFLNQKGEVLLQETDGENALVLQARKFEPIIGGDYALTATFQGMENEHIYGMGQYRRSIWTGRAVPWSWRIGTPRPACHSTSPAAGMVSCGTIPPWAGYPSAETVPPGMRTRPSSWITGSLPETSPRTSACTMRRQPALHP